MGKAIGIDLGTTNTVVAVLLDGRPQVLEDDKGYRVLPSVVTLDDRGNATVGHTARNRILTHPDRTTYAIKRLMGRRYDSEQAVEARQRVGYEIRAAPDGNCLVHMGERWLTPIEISAMVLRTAREMAERALGEPVDEAVITVPAYFNHQQRTATYEAARVAGLRCERLLNEPTAAALAYGYRKDIDRTVVVYDLGGGTFDVSVLYLSGGVYEILATRGDTFLGGEDFDYRLVDYLADHFQTQTGFDLREDRTALQRIKDAAERAKCELSFTDRTTVLVPRLTPEANLELAVTRLTLESLVEDLVERTVEVTRRAISEAGLQMADIDDVILVGGQTRMPRVREAISGLFGKEPSRGVHPEEVVAIGAAVHASSLTDDVSAPQHVLIDVTPFDLGIDVIGGLFQPIIPRNTHVPTSESRVFATTKENQDAVRITVRQGDSRFADENEFLGEFVMSGLTPAPRMETKVEVTFRIDSNGMLHATASEPATGESRRITVRNYGEVAQGKGAAAPQIESDGKGQTAVKPQQSSARQAAAPAAVGADAGKARRGGLLSGLLGRGKKATPADAGAAGKGAAAGAAAAGAAAVGAAAAAGAAAGGAAAGGAAVGGAAAGGAAAGGAAVGGAAVGGAALAGAAAVSAPDAGLESSRIQLPEVAPLPMLDDAGIEQLDEVEGVPDDDDVLEELEGDLLSPVDADSTPAAQPMAGASPSDGWHDAPVEGFELPAFEDEDDDTEMPVGLAGGAYERPDDDLFALPEETVDDELPELDQGFEALDDAFAVLDEEPAPPTAAPPAPRSFAPVEIDFDSASEELGDLVDGFEALDGGEDEPPDGAAGRPGAPPALDESDPFAGLGVDLFATESDLSPEVAAALGQTSPPPRDLTEEPDTGELFAFASTPPPSEEGEVYVGDDALDDPGEVFGLPGTVEGEHAQPDEERLFSVPPETAPRGRGGDDERTEIFARGPGPTYGDAAQARKRRRRKPARLKLAYRRIDAMVSEYRENLRRGGCFVKTSKPLPVGRECIIEVRAPGMDEPLSLSGVVTWSSVGLSALPDGQDPGMGIEYRLDDERRGEIERVLAVLGA